MSKPEDIPQDVWDAAFKACNAKFDPYSRAYVADIARAIMAAKAEEREAILAIADVGHWEARSAPEGVPMAAVMPTNQSASYAVWVGPTVPEIVAAIRKRGEA
jgi:hypothetical protein